MFAVFFHGRTDILSYRSGCPPFVRFHVKSDFYSEWLGSLEKKTHHVFKRNPVVISAPLRKVTDSKSTDPGFRSPLEMLIDNLRVSGRVRSQKRIVS